MIADRLRIVRMFHKYTQQHTADVLDIALRTYQDYEQGVRQPDLALLLKIAEFMDVPIDFLFCRDDYLQKLGVHIDIPLDAPPRRKKKQPTDNA